MSFECAVPYDPLINEEGQETSHDGNEYGIYMTDNPYMVEAAYGNPEGRGRPINSKIRFDMQTETVDIPAIGITYRIDTNGLDIRRPWISRLLQGVYNNGFEGDEWIADKVPSSNYTIEKIQIGSDFLHSTRYINITDDSHIKERLTSIMETRKARLQLLEAAIENMSSSERRHLGRRGPHMEVLKEIFGPDGAYETDVNSLDTSSVNGMKKYLFTTFYKQSPDEINFTALRYIHELGHTGNIENVEKLNETIQNDLQTKIARKEQFIQEHKDDEEPFSTLNFDKQISMLQDILSKLASKKIDNLKGTQSLGKETLIEQSSTSLKDAVELRNASTRSRIGTTKRVQVTCGSFIYGHHNHCYNFYHILGIFLLAV